MRTLSPLTVGESTSTCFAYLNMPQRFHSSHFQRSGSELGACGVWREDDLNASGTKEKQIQIRKNGYLPVGTSTGLLPLWMVSNVAPLQ